MRRFLLSIVAAVLGLFGVPVGSAAVDLGCDDPEREHNLFFGLTPDQYAARRAEMIDERDW